MEDVEVAGAAPGAGAVVAVATAALPPRILNITTPQVGHLPLIALRPFFIVSSTAFEISFLALHFTQYPSGIYVFRRALHASIGLAVTLRAGCLERQLPIPTVQKPA